MLVVEALEQVNINEETQVTGEEKQQFTNYM